VHWRLEAGSWIEDLAFIASNPFELEVLFAVEFCRKKHFFKVEMRRAASPRMTKLLMEVDGAGAGAAVARNWMIF
jgi:hypothetical protein